jgi:energy-coupling factor transporter ATP-binding protein EcfA2
MIQDFFFVHEFRPLFLTVEGVGPFQNAPFRLDFTDADSEPSNFFLLLSQNGLGKTSLMELMATLMDQFALEEPEALGFEDIDRGMGRAQWDFWVRLSREGREETFVLSIGAGRGDPWSLNSWDDKKLKSRGAEAWRRFGFRRRQSGRFEPVGKSDAAVADLHAAIRSEIDGAPQAFEDDPRTLPTLLYFSAYRDIPKVTDWDRGIMQPNFWGYRPVHRFGRESEGWRDSLDNLLVWLKWLEDDTERRYEQVIRIINERVFKGTTKYLKGIRKQPPEAVISNDGRPHRLDRLSSGEKSLVQLYLRAGIHMTRNTILVVDEMDVHLHPKWQQNLLNMFKQMAREHDGLTIIASTHARELIPAFAHEVPEAGLRKAGHIIEEGLA